MRARTLTLALLLLSTHIPSSAWARVDVQSIADKAVDAVLFRPMGAAAMVVGGVFFVPVALMTSPSGRDGLDQAWEVFIEPPYESTVERDLGDF